MKNLISVVVVVVLSAVSSLVAAQASVDVDHGYECTDTAGENCYSTLNGCPEAICIPRSHMMTDWGADNDGVSCWGTTEVYRRDNRGACPDGSSSSGEDWDAEGNDPALSSRQDRGWSVGVNAIMLYSGLNGLFFGAGPSLNLAGEDWDASMRLYLGIADPSSSPWCSNPMYEDFCGVAPATGAMFQWTWNGALDAEGGFAPFLHGEANANLGRDFTGFNSFDISAGPGIQYWFGEDFFLEGLAGMGYSQYAEHGGFGWQLGLGAGYDF